MILVREVIRIAGKEDAERRVFPLNQASELFQLHEILNHVQCDMIVGTEPLLLDVVVVLPVHRVMAARRGKAEQLMQRSEISKGGNIVCAP